VFSSALLLLLKCHNIAQLLSGRDSVDINLGEIQTLVDVKSGEGKMLLTTETATLLVIETEFSVFERLVSLYLSWQRSMLSQSMFRAV
jgi:hypothetical protein